MSTTHFPNGVTNAVLESAFGNIPFPDPTLWHTYFNDFDEYTAGDWVVTETQAGATQALTAGNGGRLLLTNTATEDDLLELQKTPAGFALTSTKKAMFSCRFQTSDVTQQDLMFGLVIVDTSPFASEPTDGIYFQSLDGTAVMSIISRKNATTGSTSASVATLANDTAIVLQWYYDGAGNLYYGSNNQQLGVIDITNYFPDATNLTVTMAMQAGEAGAETMTVDYVFAAVER
jgi:hypothetical protein